MRYMVVVEEGPSSFGAYVPDLPGCIAVGERTFKFEMQYLSTQKNEKFKF